MIYGIQLFFLFSILTGSAVKTDYADMILYHGKISTMDPDMPVAEAIAIRNDKIIALGPDQVILTLAGEKTLKVYLGGLRVIPGLIDNHVHPLSAAQSEYRKALPDIDSVDDLLAWISKESELAKPGEWIVHPKFFFTRLKEKRWPSLKELDAVAPENPVFLNGSYAGMINTKALEISDLLKLQEQAVVKDNRTQKPTGLIRQTGFKYLNTGNAVKLTLEERLEALQTLFGQYNTIGITSICAGNGGASDLDLLNELKNREKLSVRVFQNFSFPFDPKASSEQIKEALKEFPYRTGDGNEWVKVGALKVVLDGGILTGTAFMGNPWGKKAMKLYGFPDPAYRGELNLTRTQLTNLMTTSSDAGWKFTAHVTGGAGVDTLLAAYQDANNLRQIHGGRHSVIHGNFFSKEAIGIMASLGIYADVQPVWFYKDVDLLNEVLGEKRMKDFHPYRKMEEAHVMLNGGSDHMVKLDADKAINPYNPFQAMWTLVSRQSQGKNKVNAHQAITREAALRMYTINNAYASFEEKLKGSLKAGKLADLVVLSEDLLTCPEDHIKDIKPVLTMVGGKIVYDNLFMKK
jgi:predicted amidohydrolase YtcJ